MKYDFLDRLSSSPGWLDYGYDGNGNRTSETVEGAAATWSYAAGTDRVIDRRVGVVKTHAFAYDLQVNVSAIGKYDVAGSAVTSALCLRHDALGRLTLVGATAPSAVAPDGTACTADSSVTSAQARFKYDASSRRIARQDAATGQWTYVIPDSSGNPLSELALVQVEYPAPATAATASP